MMPSMFQLIYICSASEDDSICISPTSGNKSENSELKGLHPIERSLLSCHSNLMQRRKELPFATQRSRENERECVDPANHATENQLQRVAMPQSANVAQSPQQGALFAD
jgi:hypothetical protein